MVDLSNMELHAWRVGKLHANIEEGVEDIELAVCYEDHGDDFLYIRTKDKKAFIYGWFINRPFWTRDDDAFVRKPEQGIVGKANAKSADNLIFDEVLWIVKNGEKLSSDDYYISYDDPDEYGICSGYLELDQFEDGAIEKVRGKVLERKIQIQTYLNDLNLESDNLRELLEIRDNLDQMYLVY